MSSPVWLGVQTSLNICQLGSGSGGNATLVSTDQVRLLVDAGFSFREISKRLEAIGERSENLDAVLVSHEHFLCDFLNLFSNRTHGHKKNIYVTFFLHEPMKCVGQNLLGW